MFFFIDKMSVLFLMGIADVLNQWDRMGVFQYVLPFLLIFALVFALLARVKVLGESKGVHAIIALAVALLALQFDTVPNFFQKIFPQLGVGLAILLAVVILLGFFIDFESNTVWANSLAGFAALIAIVIIIFALSSNNMISGYGWWEQYWPHIIIGIIVIAAVVTVIATGKKSSGGRAPGTP